MTLTMRPCQDEGDYFRVRNFLREVFLLNNHRNIATSGPTLDTCCYAIYYERTVDNAKRWHYSAL